MGSFGNVLRKLRKQDGLTQTELGKALGLSYSTISMYERGEREPDFETLEIIADYFNVSMDYLHAKESKKAFDDNYIPATAMLPIYGCIPAGLPALAEECVEGFMPTSIPNPDEYFYLRVKGNSMIGAGIVDGCKVLIHKQNTADDGQIVACRVNGDKATLKRFKHHGSVILLKPENSAYDERIVPVEDFENGSAQIIGIVKQIVIDM